MAIATLETRIAAQALSALGQAGRLGALQVLAAAGPEGVPFRQLAVALGMTHSNLSRQLRVLEGEGLVERRQDDANVVYAARADGLTALQAILVDVGRALAVSPQRSRPSLRRRGVSAGRQRPNPRDGNP